MRCDGPSDYQCFNNPAIPLFPGVVIVLGHGHRFVAGQVVDLLDGDTQIQEPRHEGMTQVVRLNVAIRPPLAVGRLQILDAEQVAFSLKSVWSDGTYQIVLSPDELLEKLAALVPQTPAQRRHRLAWAVLLARVWAIEVTECPACGGRMKIVAAVTDPCSIRRYLEGVGLPARAPPIAPARPQRQQELDLQFAAAQT